MFINIYLLHLLYQQLIFYRKMEIKINTQQILKFLNILSWIIFIGLCIDAGGIFFNAIFIHFVNSNAAEQSWKGVDLSNLYNFDIGHFL